MNKNFWDGFEKRAGKNTATALGSLGPIGTLLAKRHSRKELGDGSNTYTNQIVGNLVGGAKGAAAGALLGVGALAALRGLGAFAANQISYEELARVGANSGVVLGSMLGGAVGARKGYEEDEVASEKRKQ